MHVCTYTNIALIFTQTKTQIEVCKAMDEGVLPLLPPLSPTGYPASLPAISEVSPCDCSFQSAHTGGSSLPWRAAPSDSEPAQWETEWGGSGVCVGRRWRGSGQKGERDWTSEEWVWNRLIINL